MTTSDGIEGVIDVDSPGRVRIMPTHYSYAFDVGAGGSVLGVG